MKLTCHDRVLDLSEPCVMGVLNVTPDSFSDGGRFLDRAAAVERGLAMVGEGAAIIDVGGESTRPGATGVDVDEEIARIVPVIEQLAARVPVPISVDTTKQAVMRAAIAAGASLINDVNALRAPGALQVVATTGAGVCLMHMQGEPRTMQAAPAYTDVVGEVRQFLAERIAACIAAGISRDRICVDPGIGFGKRPEHNLALLAAIDRLADSDLPVLIGVSRKSLVGMITGRAPADRLAGSVAFAALAVMGGAAIIRAHDVAETLDAVKVASALRRAALGGK
jgi:dihydropteroate synthase